MQMNEVKWLKFPVGFTTSVECMRMRTIRRGSRSMRDKLLCFWIELFDLAGRLDSNGRLMRENVIMDAHDLARYVDRRQDVVEFCLMRYIEAGLLSIDGETGAYYLTGWEEHQSTEKMKQSRRKRSTAACDKEKGAATDNDAGDVTEEKRKEENKREKKIIEKEENRKEETREESDPERFERRRHEAIEALKRRAISEQLGKERDPKRTEHEKLLREYA